MEHWSFLTFAQRLEAAARGLPAVTTASLAGSSMADNPGYALVDTPFGEVGAARGLRPRRGAPARPRRRPGRQPGLRRPQPRRPVGRAGRTTRGGGHGRPDRRRHPTLVASREGAGHTGCWPWPRHPMGAHPGGLFARDVPVDPYGEDLDFWSDARDASHGDDFDAWIRRWVLDPADQAAYLAELGDERVATLRRRSAADSWREDEIAHPPDLEAEPGRGSSRRCSGPATWPTGWSRRRPMPCWPAPGWPTWRRGSPSSWPTTTARRWCSPPSWASGGTSPPSPTRSCSTTAASRRPPCWAMPIRCSAAS